MGVGNCRVSLFLLSLDTIAYWVSFYSSIFLHNVKCVKSMGVIMTSNDDCISNIYMHFVNGVVGIDWHLMLEFNKKKQNWDQLKVTCYFCLSFDFIEKHQNIMKSSLFYHFQKQPQLFIVYLICEVQIWGYIL